MHLIFIVLTPVQRMDDRHWMYTGCPCQATMTDEWIRKTNDFLERAWVRLKDPISYGVRASDVEIRNGKRRRLWANIFASMDLRRTIPGGSFMVKATV